jgi:hypothetical protein
LVIRARRSKSDAVPTYWLAARLPAAVSSSAYPVTRRNVGVAVIEHKQATNVFPGGRAPDLDQVALIELRPPDHDGVVRRAVIPRHKGLLRVVWADRRRRAVIHVRIPSAKAPEKSQADEPSDGEVGCSDRSGVARLATDG